MTPFGPVRRSSGTVILWILALVFMAVAGGFLLSHQARRFSENYAKVESDRKALFETGQKMQVQVRELEQERGTLSQSAETLTIDRNNLTEQTQKLMAAAAQRATSAELHEQVLKRATEENRALKAKLMPLEDEFAALQGHHDTLRHEYETLEQALYTAQQGTDNKARHTEREQEQKQREQDLASLRQTRARIKELEIAQAKTKAELSKVQGKFGTLQDQYTGILSENKSLAVRAKKVPKEVTTLAREHERLVKDLADTHYNMGVIFAKSEEYARAAKEFEMVIQLKPEDPDANYNLGLIYAEHIPDRGKATDFFRRYLEHNPGAKDASWIRSYIASWKAWDASESLEP